jgi:hypothetical protein
VKDLIFPELVGQLILSSQISDSVSIQLIEAYYRDIKKLKGGIVIE